MRLKLIHLALLFPAAACHADTIIVAATGLPSAYENGNYGSSNATYNGFVEATIGGIPNQWMICDDFTHDTLVPSGNMIYDSSTVGGSNPLANVRFTGGSMTQNYQEAGVLVWELYNYESLNGPLALGNTVTDYQYAIWNIFDPFNAATNPNGVQVNANQRALQSSALNLISTQAAFLNSTVFSYVKVYTPDPHGGATSNQEFLQFGTPEPGTLLLVGGALLIGASVKARRVLRKR